MTGLPSNAGRRGSPSCRAVGLSAPSRAVAETLERRRPKLWSVGDLGACLRRRQAAGPPERFARRRAARWGRWWWLALLLGVFAGALPAQAQFLYRRVNLTDLVQRADIIVQGRVTEVRYEGLPGYPHISTVRVTLDVERMLRGPADNQYTFREFLLATNRARGKRGYAAGQQLLLFLPEPSRYGLSSPLGGEQGRFRIQPDQKGNVVVANEFGNLGLFYNVAESAAQAGLSLSGDELRVTSTARGPVLLEDFVSLVEQLASVPKFE